MKHILTRKRETVNTDPQGRCYNGCLISSELRWTAWEVLTVPMDEELIPQKLKFWTELNDYAVSERGESARREFKVETPTNV